jgi:hypothetical protein
LDEKTGSEGGDAGEADDFPEPIIVLVGHSKDREAGIDEE